MGSVWAPKKESMEQKFIYTLHFHTSLKAVDFFQQLCEFFVPKEKNNLFFFLLDTFPNTITQFSTTHVLFYF